MLLLNKLECLAFSKFYNEVKCLRVNTRAYPLSVVAYCAQLRYAPTKLAYSHARDKRSSLHWRIVSDKKVFYKMKLWLKLFIGQEHILGAGQAGTIKLLAVLINASLW